MAGETYDSVPLRVERHDEQGVYKLGVVIDNAFVTFAAVKTGTVDELVERERERAAEQSRQDAAEQQQREQAERQRQQAEQQRREAEQQQQQPPE